MLGGLLFLSACANPDQAVEPTRIMSLPFEIALKIPACLVTVGASGPGAAAAYMAYPGQREQDLRRGLDEGLRRNCGQL
jgi:hypothetical protein